MYVMIKHKLPVKQAPCYLHVNVHVHIYIHAVSHWGPTHMQEHLRIQAVESVWGECHWQTRMGTWNPGRLYLELHQQFWWGLTATYTIGDFHFLWECLSHLPHILGHSSWTRITAMWGNRLDAIRWTKMSKCSVWVMSLSSTHSKRTYQWGYAPCLDCLTPYHTKSPSHGFNQQQRS